LISAKVQVSEPVKELLRTFDPDERSLVVGVFRLLEDDLRRDTEKFDLYLPPTPDGKPSWGFATGKVWVGFVENDDGTVTIISATILSKFRQRDD
jgi:hypothetical protein